MEPVKNHQLSFSLEEQDIALSNVSGSPTNVATNSSSPALTARYEFGSRCGLAGVLRELDVESSGIDDSACSWGVYTQYAKPLWPSATFKRALWVGEGMGSYMSRNPKDGYAKDGKIKAIEHASGYMVLEQRWIRRLSSTFARERVPCGRVQRKDVPDSLAAIERRRVDTVWGDIFFDLMPRVTFGLEYAYARSERFDGRNGNASRINATMMTQF